MHDQASPTPPRPRGPMAEAEARAEALGAPAPGEPSKGPNPDPLYTIQQAAAYLNIPELAMRQLTAARRVAVVAFSERRLRIRRSALEAYIAEGTRPATRGPQ